jgi:hypothetical protein
MASGMGVALQRQFENAADGSRVLRQVFYARYIDWCKSDVSAPNRSSLTRCVQLQPSLLPSSCWVSGSVPQPYFGVEFRLQLTHVILFPQTSLCSLACP